MQYCPNDIGKNLDLSFWFKGSEKLNVKVKTKKVNFEKEIGQLAFEFVLSDSHISIFRTLFENSYCKPLKIDEKKLIF